ncbi:MAG: hypothetical protein JSR79_04690 [Proteobacteria bacterium]|nr:hypothetical protein [Pseudomonadota bacterium]
MHHVDRIAGEPGGWRKAVFDSVDEAYFAQGALPPGNVAQLHRALDAMREEHVDHEIIARAEAIAVTLHRLLAAIHAAPGDDMAVRPIRRELRAMGVDWLKAMPVFH